VARGVPAGQVALSISVVEGGVLTAAVWTNVVWKPGGPWMPWSPLSPLSPFAPGVPGVPGDPGSPWMP
jgi:hypothetical protein